MANYFEMTRDELTAENEALEEEYTDSCCHSRKYNGGGIFHIEIFILGKI